MAFISDNTRRVVVKVGTGVLTSGIGQVDTHRIADIADQVAGLRKRGIQVIVVSSGAILLGMGRMGLPTRPRQIAALQACASVGQSILTNTWAKAFTPHDLTVGQLLLTREDLRSRKRHVRALELMEHLLANGVVPVINENDSISTEEIRFGDNDILAALVSSLVKADLLVILSTAGGLVDRTRDGAIIPVVDKITPEIRALADRTTSGPGTGGMVTKLEAAHIANQSGCGVFIGPGNQDGLIRKLIHAEAPGTFFVPRSLALRSRKRHIAFFQTPEGTVRVDAGAVRALKETGGSLLAKGVTAVEGSFDRGAVVSIASPDGTVFAKGLSQYSQLHLQQVAGLSTDDIKRIFPRRKRLEVVHRDGLVLL
ncbi:MAG: glutamate 5-kinase [Opitutales bacterium]